MKLIFKKIERNGPGTIKMIAQESEDMWHVYNLIVIGDEISASSLRSEFPKKNS